MIGRQHYVNDVLMKVGASRNMTRLTNQEALADLFELLPCDVISQVSCVNAMGTEFKVPSVQHSVFVFVIMARRSSKAQEWMYELGELQSSSLDLLNVMRTYEKEGCEAAKKLLAKITGNYTNAKTEGAKLLRESLGVG
eukprot:TRINITY_DN6911_c0_g1_i2.p1 TRINITY_DN6911_c0_g1~~TRINITY_DN6911_c0_g1_i2.p1  ORF type:complete len:139 (+),score=31.85 TRINITY_DN6911_c0_g1_i2:149-565(+)